MRIFAWALAVPALFSLTGCGGGSAGGYDAPSVSVTPSTTVVIKAVGAQTILFGVQFTLQLPAGSSLATDSSGAPASGVLVPAVGADGGIVVVNYQPGASPRTVTVSLTKGPPGFPVGDLLRLTALISESAEASPAGFILSDFKAYQAEAVIAPVTGEVSYPAQAAFLAVTSSAVQAETTAATPGTAGYLRAFAN
jgi:hypothetical protein